MTPRNELGKAREEAEHSHALAEKRTEQATARLSDLDAEIAAVESQLGELEVELEEALDDKTRLESLRVKRRKLRARKDDLVAERPLLERRLGNIQVLEQRMKADLQVAVRRVVQAEGENVARKIRDLIAQLDNRFQRWYALSEQDRVAKDTLRTLAPDRLNEIASFAWNTGVDQMFPTALKMVIAESQKAERILERRSAARAAV